jgi:hypothetical protein
MSASIELSRPARAEKLDSVAGGSSFRGTVRQQSVRSKQAVAGQRLLVFFRTVATHRYYKWALAISVLFFLIGEWSNLDEVGQRGIFNFIFFLISLFVLACELCTRFHYGLLIASIKHFEFHFLALNAVIHLCAFLWCHSNGSSPLDTISFGAMFFLANMVVISFDAAPLLHPLAKLLLPCILASHIVYVLLNFQFKWSHGRSFEAENFRVCLSAGQCLQSKWLMTVAYISLLVYNVKYAGRFLVWRLQKVQPRCIVLHEDISFGLCEMPIGGDPFLDMLDQVSQPAWKVAARGPAGQLDAEGQKRKKIPIVFPAVPQKRQTMPVQITSPVLSPSASSSSSSSASPDASIPVHPAIHYDDIVTQTVPLSELEDEVSKPTTRTSSASWIARPSLIVRDVTRTKALHVTLTVVPSPHTKIAMRRFKQASYHPFISILPDVMQVAIEQVARSKIYLAWQAAFQICMWVYDEVGWTTSRSYSSVHTAMGVLAGLCMVFFIVCEASRVDRILLKALFKTFAMYYMLVNLGIYIFSGFYSNMAYAAQRDESGELHSFPILRATWQGNLLIYFNVCMLYSWAFLLDSMPTLSFKFKRLMVSGLLLNIVRTAFMHYFIHPEYQEILI